MARFTGFDEVYSSLYVDFDNIYTRFLEADPEAAKSFGYAPYRWVRWCEKKNSQTHMLFKSPKIPGIQELIYPERISGCRLSATDDKGQNQHGHPSCYGLHGRSFPFDTF